MASGAEREIRDLVVAKLRLALPAARIIHELNTHGQSSRRLDLAAVTPEMIYGVEIKSGKDTADRLDGQVKAFRSCCHRFIIAADEKFFDEKSKCYSETVTRGGGVWSEYETWMFPEPPAEAGYPHQNWRWTMPAPTIEQPAARSLLSMLWAEELRSIASRHRLDVGRRATMEQNIDAIAYHLTGKQIAHEACAALRGRDFAEADAPIRASAA